MNAADIKAAAARVIAKGDGNLGRYKAFVAPLAQELGVDVETLKHQLLDMHRNGEIELSRCDLQADYRELVRESEISYLGLATYHLVRVSG